jgi:hypothetical protein
MLFPLEVWKRTRHPYGGADLTGRPGKGVLGDPSYFAQDASPRVYERQTRPRHEGLQSVRIEPSNEPRRLAFSEVSSPLAFS